MYYKFVCTTRKKRPLVNILRKTTPIEWDEWTMSHREHSKALNRTLRDIRSCDVIMGEINFVFVVDIRQTLPDIPIETRVKNVKACLKSSPLWAKIGTLQLRTNMRTYFGGRNSEFLSQLL